MSADWNSVAVVEHSQACVGNTGLPDLQTGRKGLSGPVSDPQWNRDVRDEESRTVNLALVDEERSAVLTVWNERKKDMKKSSSEQNIVSIPYASSCDFR